MDKLTFILLRLAPSLMEWGLMLLPLAIYLLWLGFGPGRSPRPLLLSGRKDTVLLILGLSGFFLLGPFTWILHRFGHSNWHSYALAYLAYLSLLIALAWTWIVYRRQSLVIYSISPSDFSAHLQSALQELDRPYQVTPGRVAVEGQRLVLDLQASPLLFCVTLIWHGDPELWSTLEVRLRKNLSDIETHENPAGNFLPLCGGLVLLMVSLSIIVFFWYYAFLSL